MSAIAWMAAQPRIKAWTAERVGQGEVTAASIRRVLAVLERAPHPMTNKEIAAELGISQERVRAITRAALLAKHIEVRRGRRLGNGGSEPVRYFVPGGA